ncbi:MAG: hypothetical protein V1904_15145 [Bacteroidota bacterium]
MKIYESASVATITIRMGAACPTTSPKDSFWRVTENSRFLQRKR